MSYDAEEAGLGRDPDQWHACDFETTTYLDGEPRPYKMTVKDLESAESIKPGGAQTTIIVRDERTLMLDVHRSDEGEFTATVQGGRVRVWSWAIASLHEDRIHHGTDIAEFVEKAADLGGVFWFHNLRFDGAFLDAYLQSRVFGLGMMPTRDKKRSVRPGEFSALIGDTGAHYSRYVVMHDGRSFEVRDSLKKYPSTSIESLAGMFDAPVAKGKIDYEAIRPVGYWPTPDEWEYLDADVIILRTALRVTKDAGLLGLTVGGDALTEYTATMRHGRFRTVYPLLDRDTDDFIRRAYRGGWTYINPLHQGKVLDCAGEVYDVNSMYPAVMRSMSYPVGVPVSLAPGQTELEGYPHVLYGALLDAYIKPGRLPMIQVKNDARYNPVEYLTKAEGVEWFGTEVDWALLHDQYDVTIHEWIGGRAFRGITGLFDRYIDKWMKVKETTKGGQRTQAKFQLNNLWGRFGINPLRAGRLPAISKDGTPEYHLTAQVYDEPCYTPVAVWTTSYGRDRVIRAAQSFGDDFLAADTDSVHKLGIGSADLEVHDTRIGAWALEATFDKSVYLRAKAYAERIDGKVESHVAGLPRNLLDNEARAERGEVPFNVEDLVVGAKFAGKLQPKRVPGGIILESTDFEIGERDAWGHGR